MFTNLEQVNILFKRKNMKKIMALALAFMCVVPMFAGKEKHAEVFQNPEAYSCVFINVATSGTKNIKVSGIGKKKDVAVEKAIMNAIHAVIFKGIAGGTNGQPTPPMYPSASPSADHQDYFDAFFNNCEYKQFSTQVSNPSGNDMSEVKGGIKVKVEIQVMFDALRKKLIQDGIIQGVANALEGAQKPRIMIFPDEDWCKSKSYVMSDDHNTVDYNKALANVDMKDLINEFTNFMANVAGYEIEDLAASLKDYRNEKAWSAADEADDGEGTGGDLREMLASAVSADFIIEFYPETRTDAGKQFVVFRIKVYDASTNKSFYSISAQGTATYGSGQMVNQLKEAILNVKDEFLGALQTKFTNMSEIGREIRITLQRKESCPVNFASKYDGAPLSEYIEDWLQSKIQTPGFSRDKNTANKASYKQIYIPLFKEKKNRVTGKADRIPQSAADFAQSLADFITEITGQACRVDARSIGYAVITLGQDDAAGYDE